MHFVGGALQPLGQSADPLRDMVLLLLGLPLQALPERSTQFAGFAEQATASLPRLIRQITSGCLCRLNDALHVCHVLTSIAWSVAPNPNRRARVPMSRALLA